MNGKGLRHFGVMPEKVAQKSEILSPFLVVGAHILTKL